MYNGTHMQLHRPPGVSHLFSVSPSHFPTEFRTPFPAGYWLHSPPILTHSFHLAALCRPLPSSPCCQSISMAAWLTDSELDAHFSQWWVRVWFLCVAMAGLAWCWNGWIQCHTHTHTHTHTQSNGSFSITKHLGCHHCCDVSFMSPLSCLLFWICWQKYFSGFCQPPKHSQAQMYAYF